jgi:hypothetical protein
MTDGACVCLFCSKKANSWSYVYMAMGATGLQALPHPRLECDVGTGITHARILDREAFGTLFVSDPF